MASTYTIYLEAEAAKYLFGLRRPEREPVRRFLDFLADYPHTEGETTERDSVGRTVQVKLLRRIKVVLLGGPPGQGGQNPPHRMAHPTQVKGSEMKAKLTMVCWKSKKFWLGKLIDHPEIMTQGRTLKELEENIKDACRMMVMKDVPEKQR